MKTVWKYINYPKLRAETPEGQHPGISVPVPGNDAEKFIILDRQSQTKEWIWLGNKPGGSVMVVPMFELRANGNVMLAQFLMDETIKMLLCGVRPAEVKEVTILAHFAVDRNEVAYIGMYVERNG